MKKIIFLIFSISLLFSHTCNTKLFSLETQGENSINLQDIITDLSDTCNLNIIIKDNIAKAKLKDNLKYIKLKNVSLDEFLNYVLGENGFFYNLKNDTLSISFIKTKSFKIDYVNNVISGTTSFTAATAEGSTTGGNTINSTFSFDFWTDFTTNITSILNSNANSFYQNPLPIIDKNSGLVTITGTKEQLQRIQKYIDELNNRLHKQVLVDVRIYSVSLTKNNQTGVNWNNFSLAMSTGDVATRGTQIGTTILGSTTFNLSGLLDFLSGYGQVNAISNPKITTLNNQKAIITVGQTVNYSYKVVTSDGQGNLIQSDKIDSKFVGILLDITPEISDNGVIMMSINPSVSSIVPIQPKPNLPPDTIEKKLNTMVRVKDGQTIILGGLITDEKTFTNNGVPVLKEIPLVKYLFSYKSETSKKEELIFVITPHIVDLNKKTKIHNIGFKLPELGDF